MKCSICGRKLIHPKSIKLGYGPICYSRVFGSKKSSTRKTANSQESSEDCGIPGQMKLEDYFDICDI